MSEDLSINYNVPGQTIRRFMQATARIQVLQGPIGGGKTSAVLIKPLLLAQAQKPSPRDGVRYYRHVVVRDTYRQLWKTTIPTWHYWVPPERGKWNGAVDGPASHVLTMNTPKGPAVYQVDFVAIGDNRAEDVLRGYETTSFGLDEADLLDKDVFVYARGRAGRYPKMSDGGPSWYGVLMSLNAPEFDTWTYKRIVDGRWHPGEHYFRQPPAMIRDGARLVLNPKAENLANLPDGYYDNQIEDQPDWYVRRMILNEFGYSRHGLPVYPEFNDELHVAGRELEPVEGLPLLIGLDAGLRPAAALCQRMPDGQWRCLDELAAEPGTGAGRFGDALNRLLKARYSTFTAQLVRWDASGADGPRPIQAYGDPSAATGYDKDPASGEYSWLQMVAHKTGIRCLPAPGNNKLSPRLEAVRQPLTRMIDGHVPGFLISPRCKVLRAGFNAGYRYRQVQAPGEEKYILEPEKNEYSHVHDALQYVMLAGGEYNEVMGRKKAASGGNRQRLAITEDNPTGEWDPPGRSAISDW